MGTEIRSPPQRPSRRAPGADERRFGALYERCAQPITVYCTRRLDASRVDDAVAETFVVAWRRIDDVPDADAELLWLYRVAANVVRHEWRSRGRRDRLRDRLHGLRPIGRVGPADGLLVAEEHEQILGALELLDPADAEVLRLVAWEELSTAEVAVVLGIGANAASQRISRARRRLASHYARLGESPVGPTKGSGA